MTIRLDNKRSKERKKKREKIKTICGWVKKRIKPENETLRRNGDYVMLVSNDKRRF